MKLAMNGLRVKDQFRHRCSIDRRDFFTAPQLVREAGVVAKL